ncbi:DsrE family protein [Aliarcobacter lanthieri]|uniref:DsrE family protein n=1 Tax=Aliarcobacter lanthieri TaxID=1355374 RepID=UPI00047C0F30|nr:DsrE family protein [Aliarcobacter lanthieri]QKF58712.1 intracellular sulfur oxidation protein, DsrE/DsrF family [Aliarcobacter lanthieri]
MKKLLLICIFAIYSFGVSTFSNPQPSFESPRKVVYSLYVNDLDTVKATVGSMYNILKEYPAESLKIVVVAYGKGMRVFKNDYDKTTLDRIKSLMEYDVEFIGCRNTMETMGWKDEDFIDGMSFVQAGIVEVIERQVDGYIGITAY